MQGADERDLKVVARASVQIGKREEIKERFRLSADAALRDGIADEGAPLLGSKICTGLPNGLRVWEKSPLRSSGVGIKVDCVVALRFRVHW